MTDSFIPYGKQSLDETDIKAVSEVLRSSWLTTGPLVQRFEEALAEKVGARFCVVFNSGTAALHGAYFAAGVGNGDEVITTPITFAATANAALYLGGKPVFADIAPGSLHIDIEQIEAAITERTRVITPVDMAGIPADIDQIMALAGRHNLIVVEDACHALGATYKGRNVGSIADMSIFSFHPVKQITTGEGGAVTTDREEFYQRLKIFRNHGIVRDSFLFASGSTENDKGSRWYYEQQALGYNYRLPDINCALGLSQLKKLDQFVQRRREIAIRYNESFKNNHALIIPQDRGNGDYYNEPSWHLYILRLTGQSPPRRRLLERLHEKGIGTQVHYIPVYLHPYYQKLGYQPGICPRAEDYYKRAFSIPLYPAMNDQDVQRVVEMVGREVEAFYH